MKRFKQWLKHVWSGPTTLHPNSRPTVVQMGEMDVAIINTSLTWEDSADEPCLMLRKMKTKGPFKSEDMRQAIGPGDILIRFNLNTTTVTRLISALRRVIRDIEAQQDDYTEMGGE